MKLGFYYGNLEIYRKEKIIFGKFLHPHRVISTCRSNGGLREDLEYLYNHQSCEPANHTGIDLSKVAVQEPDRYNQRICKKAGISADKSAGLGTAANMKNAAIVQVEFKGLIVVAVSTAGVGSNATRAGDTASYYQTESGPCFPGMKPPQAGTINTLLFINEELSPGALVVAVSVATEAKSALLQELSIPSKHSNQIATGTGTDQMGIASMMGTSICHTDSNKHSKMGELIASATRQSLQQALSLQCGMIPDNRRSSVAMLMRFGESEESLKNSVADLLPEEEAGLFKRNFLPVNHDPVTVAAIQGIVHLKDQITWGVLPDSCSREIFLSAGAQLVEAVSDKPADKNWLKSELKDFCFNSDDDCILDLIHKCIALGFDLKWQDRFQD